MGLHDHVKGRTVDKATEEAPSGMPGLRAPGLPGTLTLAILEDLQAR